MKTMRLGVLLWILYAGVFAQAVCVGASVNSFGAKGDGHTDDTAAIQAAINAASSAGGGSVVFNGAAITRPVVSLCRGAWSCTERSKVRFDVAGVNPATTAIAPTLLVTNTASPFLTLQGFGAGVTDLLFHYPNQVPSSAASPTVYPYTILVKYPGTKIARSTVTNAYDFLDIEVGRVMAQDLFMSIQYRCQSRPHPGSRHAPQSSSDRVLGHPGGSDVSAPD